MVPVGGLSREKGGFCLEKRIFEISQSLAVLIEEKYGYNAEWVLNGTEPKLKQVSKDKSLSRRGIIS